CNLTVLCSRRSHQPCFQQQQQAAQLKSSDKPTAHYLPNTNQQTDKVRDKPVNIVEQLKSHIFPLRSWWRPKTELKESECWTCIHQVEKP
ncbi:hypothetical protein DVA76_17630, partial [Acinetobacter baumannii]